METNDHKGNTCFGSWKNRDRVQRRHNGGLKRRRRGFENLSRVGEHLEDLEHLNTFKLDEYTIDQLTRTHSDPLTEFNLHQVIRNS